MKIKSKISVKGIKPLLFHTFPISVLSEKTSKTGESEWKETVLMNDARELYVMNTYFLNSIKDGGKEVKVGRGNLSKKLASTLEVEPLKIFLDGLMVPEDKDLLRLDSEAVYLDIRAVVNPMTKGKNLRYRIAARPGWTCNFILSWDDYIASKEQVKICIENGGLFQGVGDGRSIGFGRYEIISFEMLK